MSKEMKFKKIVAQYCTVEVGEMKKSSRFREDLGFSSLDFMSLLGELEDEFDLNIEEENMESVLTIGDALELIDNLKMAG